MPRSYRVNGARNAWFTGTFTLVFTSAVDVTFVG
jgi:hypothetical protein